MIRPTEKQRFQKWERSLNFKLTATDRECEWAIKKSKQLDRAGLTKFPTYPLPITGRCATVDPYITNTHVFDTRTCT